MPSLENPDTQLYSTPSGLLAVELTENIISYVEQGPRGAAGEKGEKGDRGLPGTSFEFRQDVATDVWVIPHMLTRHPSVTIVDSAGDEVEGAIRYDSPDQVTITFSAAFGGVAYLN